MTIKNQENNNILLHPLAGSNLPNLINLLNQNGEIAPRYFLRLLKIILISIYGIPFRAVEKKQFERRIESTQIIHPPIFIIGHWRSGTTYLHRLMSLDNNWGYVSNFQTFLPEIFLSSAQFWKPIFEMTLPKTRPMDNVVYSFGDPEEEEYALGNIYSSSFYHCLYFPKRMLEIFKESVLIDNAPENKKAEWKKTYLNFLKKVSLEQKGKRLLLKNPANTARIKTLLEIFPDAKFIHIYRNPYAVYASTKNFYDKLLPCYALQEINQEVEGSIYELYKQLMNSFLATKDLIPHKNFLEIRYENLEKDPISEIEYIYNKFEISDFKSMKEKLEKYVMNRTNYQKGQYLMNEQTRKEIERQWDFALKKWKYPISEVNIN